MSFLGSIVRFRTLIFVLYVSLAPAARSSGAEIDELRAKAEKGDAFAQFELAERYAAGLGTPKDEKAALDWYLKSAAREYTPAYVGLGSIYSQGLGVKQDDAEAIRWFPKAALAGNPIAQDKLGLAFELGRGVERDYETAAAWYGLGVSQGHPLCQYHLARLYDTGRGVPVTRTLAHAWYSAAAAHENPHQIFGEATAKELVARRDALAKNLNEEFPQRKPETTQELLAGYQARVLVNPRRFGAPDGNIGATRGWYIWKSFNPNTWEAEVTHDRPQEAGKPRDTTPAEVFKVRMLPWASTYRYLTYGAGPEGLLPGERVNMFFNPDENHKRGYLVYFQDEICQMKGHYHYWRIEAPTHDGFTARVYAGDKPTGEPVREFTFDPACRVWAKGAQVKNAEPKGGDRVYLTWCLEDDKQVVKLYSDAESLTAIQAEEAARLAKKIAAEGLLGRVESLTGDQLHFMIFADHWQQAQQFKEGTRVRVSGIEGVGEKGFHPAGPTAEAVITFRKNRGQYGSGVTDLLLTTTRVDDAPLLRALRKAEFARIIRTAP